MKKQSQAAQLVTMTRIADGLLLLMALVFLVAHALSGRHHPGWGYVAAFAEAALVGGLADWFAVTALFRHPLGVPVPHTAIIPSNKDRLADGVAAFLQQNFLTRDVLAADMARLDFVGMAIEWLGEAGRRRWLAERIAAVVSDHLSVGPLLADWLRLWVDQQKHNAWFDRAVLWAQQLLDQHHADIYQRVSEKSPRWMPRRINDEFYRRLMDGVTELLDEMLAPDSSARGAFDAAVREQIAKLATGERDAAIRQQVESGAEEGVLAGRIANELEALVARLASDPALRASMNRWLQRQAVVLLVRRRIHILGLVRRVILDWNADTVTARIEGQVGRDLQFIRVNGTLVGGLVGLAIHAMAAWI